MLRAFAFAIRKTCGIFFLSRPNPSRAFFAYFPDRALKAASGKTILARSVPGLGLDTYRVSLLISPGFTRPMGMEQDFQEDFWKKGDQTEVFRHVAAASLIEHGPVLDLGAGDGFFLEYLKKKKNIDGKGVDISEEASRKAKMKGIEVLVADITKEQLPFEDDSVDTVTALDIIEHLFQPEELLEEMHRISKKYAVVATPNFCSIPARLQVLLGKVPENNKPRKGHVYWFTWKVFTSMIKKNGFEIDKIIVNANFSKKPILGKVLGYLATKRPSLFGLSFVLRLRKV